MYPLLIAALLLASNTPTQAGTVCNSNYFLNADNRCQRCTYTRCDIGFYRRRCETGSTQDAQCVPCTGQRPENSRWTTFGMPYLFDNCRWQCNTGFFLDQNSGECVPCSTGACPGDQTRQECTPGATEDAKCSCATGNYFNGETNTCTPCSTNECPTGTFRAQCDGTGTADAVCV